MNEKLLIQMVALAVRTQMDFVTFKTLTEWLEVYHMLRPMERSLSFDMLHYLVDGAATMDSEGARASKVFKAWLMADIIETVLTEKQQDRCVNILKRKDRTCHII